MPMVYPARCSYCTTLVHNSGARRKNAAVPCAGYPVTVFKGGPGLDVNVSDANFNQNGVLYKKLAPMAPVPPADGGGGGRLGAGAIAGGQQAKQ